MNGLTIVSLVLAAALLQAQPAPKPGYAPAKPAASVPNPDNKGEAKKESKFVLGHKLKSIDGTEVDLASYKGKVLLIVNVASRCGFTPQYGGLEKLHKDKIGQGLVVLGIPANNFGGQEPGSEEDIKKFCQSKYNVTFPMFAKISVKGADQHPLYKQLSAAFGEPKWNFTKYLVNREGEVVERFDSTVAPGSKELTEAIDRLLGPDSAAPPVPEKK